jgi:hypothetical protein
MPEVYDFVTISVNLPVTAINATKYLAKLRGTTI